MSLTGKRAEYKAALDLVDDVRGYEYRPGTPKPGDAWPHLDQGQREELSGQFMIAWAVGIYLPQDERSANLWIDAHLDALVDTLEAEGVGYVDAFTPANFGTETSHVYGLMLTMRGE
jgi:hypothetical protein